MLSIIYTCTVNRKASSLEPRWTSHNWSIWRDLLFYPQFLMFLRLLHHLTKDLPPAEPSYMPTRAEFFCLKPQHLHVSVDRRDIFIILLYNGGKNPFRVMWLCQNCSQTSPESVGRPVRCPKSLKKPKIVDNRRLPRYTFEGIKLYNASRLFSSAPGRR